MPVQLKVPKFQQIKIELVVTVYIRAYCITDIILGISIRQYGQLRYNMHRRLYTRYLIERLGIMQKKLPAKTSQNDLQEFAYTTKYAPKHTWGFAREILETIFLSAIMFLVINVSIKSVQVDGISMYPTLHNSQFVIVDRLAYVFSNPKRGDIIVFEYPLNHSVDYIKRVIGIPGDTVTINANGTVLVNGVQLNEPYINNMGNPYGAEKITLGVNQYFVLGDNRQESSDSRDWGTVNRSLIIGQAKIVVAPLSDFHFLPDESAVFSQIPAP